MPPSRCATSTRPSSATSAFSGPTTSRYAPAMPRSPLPPPTFLEEATSVPSPERSGLTPWARPLVSAEPPLPNSSLLT